MQVEVELITGRTHQLRAQFAALGAAIHGDDMVNGQWLRGVGGAAVPAASAACSREISHTFVSFCCSFWWCSTYQ